jgi:TPR repeat protein
MSASEQASEPEVGEKRKAVEIAPSFTANGDVFDEYVCPITQELPLEPCMAEDGHCYDRWAFEKWAQTQKAGELKSPMTNQLMSAKLYPALQVRNAIHQLIKTGIIAGEAAQKWKEKQDELEAMTKDMRETMSKAYMGDARAMRDCGFAYRDGKNGIKKMPVVALKWFREAAKHDDPYAIVSIGIFYLNGTAVPRNYPEAMIWLTRAAILGSEHACITIASYYGGIDAKTTKVMRPDKEHALYWFRKSMDAAERDSIESSRVRRNEWMAKHSGLPS